jgi:hypothetical protein
MASNPQIDEADHTPPAEVNPDEARSGVKLGIMRYVLAISLTGVIVGMVLAWIYFGW